MRPRYLGIGSEISRDYSNGLAILSAEIYDDGKGAIGADEAAKMRMDISLRADGKEAECGNRRIVRPKIEIQNAEEKACKKVKGRPRVDTKDETLSDRRRTQIRMAQRAYRHRKESFISSLKKQVQDLRGISKDMSKINFILYDYAVGMGLLQREPEFSQQLQSVMERFFALENAATVEYSNHGENHADENRKQIHNEAEPNSIMSFHNQ
ncbi:hypothetical protein V500_07306 [Pseudogymnoascus sp. VKM F-4518 (FW-2643)]|nr:hypothetical protein V500_07306 [Pseudogymnoascus sp. VKM F-4518 (FW-2643)]